MENLKKHLLLTKPGIIFGNLFTAAAGFFIASRSTTNYQVLFLFLMGTGLIIASGCVINNIMDISIDKKMERTKNRVLVKETISPRHALIFAIILGIIGTITLYVSTNLLTVLLGVIGFVDYLLFYGIGKRKTEYSTLIGSISGAMPPVAGYTAVTNRLDIGAFLLFLILVLWQMPHFYAIAIYRHDDYKAASLPVLPVKKGPFAAKLQIPLYIVAFTVISQQLTYFGYTGYIYLWTTVLLGIIWFTLSLYGFKTKNDRKWSKKMFRLSLSILIFMSILMMLNPGK